ncbi:MAG TPA: DUF1028 domain-containing protein [Gemmatimonadales bacterium]
MRYTLVVVGVLVLGVPAARAEAQETVFHTFSIAAIDPATGESGVAVTTRVACVGNGVPWVRAGVGAVATQAYTRVEYGVELLDLMANGLSAPAALREATSRDDREAFRQIGVIKLDGSSAQHTGDSTNAWAGGRAGPDYVTQGNLLTGGDVLDAVGRTFEASQGSGRHLGDRLIEALAAGQAVGGDARLGRRQSAALVVADPREGRSRRPDKMTANINICEHATPVAELRRVWNTISETLGFRELQQFGGRDVIQLRVMLHALGYVQDDVPERPSREAFQLDDALVAAIDAFRTAEGLSTAVLGSPSGLVDAQTVDRLWAALERVGKAGDVRRRLRGWTAVTR